MRTKVFYAAKYVYLLFLRVEKKFQSFFLTFWAKLQMSSYGKGLKVNYYSRFMGKVIVGNNCNFNGMRVDGNGSVIWGNNFHSGKECLIITSSHNYDKGDSLPYDSSRFVNYNVQIEDNVWFGHRVTVIGNITIGEGTIVAAGSVVVKSTPPLSIVGGNPAKIIRYRDKEHYFKLKEEGKFC